VKSRRRCGPADLPPLRLEAVVGAEAIGADDARELVPDEPVRVLLAAVGRDPHRRLLAEGAPKRARLAAEIPTGLVDVERACVSGLLEQLLVDRLERRGGASEARVDRTDRPDSRTARPAARPAADVRDDSEP
jgi:hypothetical protein